jgi:hypothetical protein
MPRPDIKLDIRTTEKQVEKALREQGGLSRWDYPKDHHFEWYVLHGINTLQDALDFCELLDRERKQSDPHYGHLGCHKARGIRSWLQGKRGEFWTADPERIRAAMAPHRRTCCGCHETCSFAPKN